MLARLFSREEHSTGWNPAGSSSQFYFGIDFPENGSFIAIETPQASGIVSADLDLGPAALLLALFVNQHSRRLIGNCANLPLEFQPAVK